MNAIIVVRGGSKISDLGEAKIIILLLHIVSLNLTICQRDLLIPSLHNNYRQ